MEDGPARPARASGVKDVVHRASFNWWATTGAQGSTSNSSWTSHPNSCTTTGSSPAWSITSEWSPPQLPRDVALEVDKDHTQRLKFSCQNGLGNISNAIWSVLLSNPDLESFRKINELAATRVQPA